MTLRAMFAAGARALRDRPLLVVAIYAVQLGVALAFAFGVARTLTALYGRSALFDRGVDGDLVALWLSLSEYPGTWTAISWIGVALALAYAVLSIYLAGGILGALAGRSFGESAARHFFSFVRLALLSLVPYAVAAVIAVVGASIASASVGLDDALSVPRLVGPPLLGALPGLLLAAITACSVDHARAILVSSDDRGAARALLSAFRLTFTRLSPLLHYLTYLALWLSITLAYLALTSSATWSPLVLLLFRQLTSLLRLAARFATTAGQLRGHSSTSNSLRSLSS